MEKMRRKVLLLYSSEEAHVTSTHALFVNYLIEFWFTGVCIYKGLGSQIIIAARSSKRFIISNLLALEKFANIDP